MIQPKIPLSPLRRQYPFPEDHKWIEGETFQGDEFTGIEGSFETLSSVLFEGGTAQFYEAFAEQIIVDDFVQIEQLLITDNTISALQPNQDIKILPQGDTGGIQLGDDLRILKNALLGLKENEDIQILPLGEDGGIQLGSSLRILDNTLFSLGKDKNIVLSPQGAGVVQSKSDVAIRSGHALVLYDEDNENSAEFTYSDSLVNFLKYSWPSPPLFVVPVPGNLVGPFLTSSFGEDLSWKTDEVPEVGHVYKVGPYFTSDSQGNLSWTTTFIEPDTPTTVGPYLTSDTGGSLSWESREVFMAAPASLKEK